MSQLTYVNPPQRDQVLLVLDVENLLLVCSRTAIGRTVLLGDYHVRNREPIVRQAACQDATSLDVVVGVLVRNVEKLGHGVLGNDDGAESPFDEGLI